MECIVDVFSIKKSTMTKAKYRRLKYGDRRVIENITKAKKTQSEIAKALGCIAI